MQIELCWWRVRIVDRGALVKAGVIAGSDGRKSSYVAGSRSEAER